MAGVAMDRISLLDCTLRDGGCVNHFDFGTDYMNCILHSLEDSGVDVIECGYIDEKEGSIEGRTQFIDERVIVEKFIGHKKESVMYVAMMDYGKYDVEKLSECSEQTVDGIRIAFHKKDYERAVQAGKVILQKGYKLFVQPMTVLRYTDSEILDLIDLVNRELPGVEAFYIVDSFGEMRLNDMKRIAYLVDHNLSREIKLGLHSHNNLQLSYSNAVTLLNFPTERNLYFDVSIMGMGKGAGNLNTELFAEHLNLYFGKQYQIVPLLEVIDKVINQIRQEYQWGYSVEYYLSSRHHCTSSYAGYFYKKHTMTIDQIDELLGKIDESKKISFDAKYAEELYERYNARQYDDSHDFERFQDKVADKRVLIVAPGKSILEYEPLIYEYIQKEDVLSISINHYKIVDTDYIFITKKQIWEETKNQNRNFLVTSNVLSEAGERIFVFDYKKWTEFDGATRDMSIVALVNILLAANVKELLLAGFDGFQLDISGNYYDNNLKRPITKDQVLERNHFMKYFWNRIKERIEIHFITPTVYCREDL